ncbi:MAG: 2-C-methyl-D-erythritol 2,4-cyclodiphosphate synthase [Actinobacteria bacterium]|nr:2-C-methyl-D-erythritol 2,4-cyclodiphosphate synthase [Actinomycetota bacterium]
MRIGHGFDVHKLVPKRKLIIGGVDVPSDRGALGHSDADVLCHAIGDALLGAAGLGDLGKHFPDTDPHFAGISSLLLLKNIIDLLKKRSCKIQNIDATVILQKPKIGPFVAEMRKNIALAAGLAVEQVSVKATTTEGLGYTGTGKGIAAHAVVLIEKE